MRVRAHDTPLIGCSGSADVLELSSDAVCQACNHLLLYGLVGQGGYHRAMGGLGGGPCSTRTATHAGAVVHGLQ